MLSETLLNVALAALAVASPVSRTRANGPACVSNRPVPTLPVNGGGTELSAPSTSNPLKHILLGFGIQNYTCSDAGATPSATGALAMLYDVTNLYPGQSSSSLDIDSFNKLGSDALWNMDVPLNMASADSVAQGADTSAPFPADSDLELDGQTLPFAGHHFFNADGTPHFVVGDINLLAAKLNQVTAPSSADVGPDSTGAVAWLQLGDAGGSTGASYVYRVITAGGASHGCSAAGDDSTAYTAQYWIYG